MWKAEDSGDLNHSLLAAFDITKLHGQKDHRSNRGKQDTFERFRASARTRTLLNTLRAMVRLLRVYASSSKH